MYRYSVADLVAAAPAQQLADWNAAYNQGGTEQLLQICQDKADQLVELKVGQQGAAMRIGLCYAQHMLAERFGYVRESALNDLLDQAAMPNGEGEKDERFPRSQRAA